MESFEDLKLPPELVEALAAEGLEQPTELQSAAIPVLLRGNNLVALAGPGAGIGVAVGAPLLARLEPASGGPVALVLVPTLERAVEFARSLGRLADATEHRVAALDPRWALPELASIVVSTPESVQRALRDSRFSLDQLKAIVVDSAATMAALAGEWNALAGIFESLPEGTQRVMTTLPRPAAVDEFIEQRMRKAVTVPAFDDLGGVTDRGVLKVRIIGADGLAGSLAELAGEVLTDDVHHLMVFAGSEDVAADLADTLTLHGFAAGAPGEADCPIWVGVDALSAREVLDGLPADSVAIASAAVPADPDTLDRRHGSGRGGWILAEPRQLAHIEHTAHRTGYRTVVTPAPRAAQPGADLGALLGTLEHALEHTDVDVYQLVLDPMFARHGAERVAAALLGALRARPEQLVRTVAPAVAAGAAACVAGTTASGAATGMVKLFVSLGERDGLRPGDLVGAIIGEAGIKGDQIGRIEIRETFSRVEVAGEVAEKVIRALNGTSVRGRSVRADLDRAERTSGAPGRTSGGHGAGPRSGPPRGGRPGAGGGRSGPGSDRRPGPGGGRSGPSGGRSGPGGSRPGKRP